MGEVGLEQDVVDAHLVDQPPRGDLLEPVAGVDVTGEVLRGIQLEGGVLLAHPVAVELVVEGLEDKGIQPMPLSTETNLMSG